MAASWDYIIIGAGSAGCVMAERLSADPRNKVLLLEAGGGDGSPLIHMPKGIGKLALNPRHAWHYKVDQPRVPDVPSTESWVRGRGLGGSSSINGMIWIRGQAEDYDLWERQHGCTGWGGDTMMRAFEAIEDHEMGPGDGRGVGGPVHISSGAWRYPLAEAVVEAGEKLGLKRRADLNGPDQEGIGYYSHNIRKGRRQSAAVAFLRPAAKRPNLKVETGVEVDRIIFTDGRATSIEAVIDGQKRSYAVGGEVILSAGVMATPAILQRSGVGAGTLLSSLGIPVVADRPGVGRHLLDHLGYSMPYRLRGVRGNNHEFQGLGLVKNVIRYGLTRTGPLATGPFEVGAFIRTSDKVKRPDAQLFASAFTFQRSTNANFPVQLSAVEKEPGFTVYGQLLRLESEGSIDIGGSGLRDPLKIAPNWLSTDNDCRVAIDMVRYIRRLMAQPSIAPFLQEEILPGAAVESDEQVIEHFRRSSRCGTHAVGVCRMGGDPDYVCDPQLRVRGVRGVRVVDCSVIPGLISGNTNAPAMALAWHGAKVIADSRPA